MQNNYQPGQEIIIGFWAKKEATPEWKATLIKRGEWQEDIFLHAHSRITSVSLTYLEFYHKHKCESWRPVYAKIIDKKPSLFSRLKRFIHGIRIHRIL